LNAVEGIVIVKSLVFEQVGQLPTLREVAAPIPEAGDAVVDVVAAPILAYHHEVFSGQRPMLFKLPFAPGTGAIGRVSALGAGATALKVGDWVYCDPTVRVRDAVGLPPISLQGLTAGGPDALQVQSQYRDGSWAEKMRLPLENVLPLGKIDAANAAQWLLLGTMLVPYGGLRSVGLQAGETVVVNGATGNFGSASIAVALAMGAACVIATGRNQAALDALSRSFGDRVCPITMKGDVEKDKAAILQCADDPIDVVFDILPPAAAASQVMAALLTVRPGGRVSLMGGVGSGGDENLSLPYHWIMRNNVTIRGQWMYERDDITRLIALVKSKQLDLGCYDIVDFPLIEADAAIAHAAEHAGPFSKTVFRL
jgi:alcohol dehydrogenase